MRAFAIVLMLTLAAPAAAQTRFTAGGQSPSGTAADDYWQAYAANIKAAAGDAIEPKLLTRGELGSEDQILTALRRDRIQVAINGFLALTAVIPELDVLGAPYLFGSAAEMMAATETELTPRLARLFDAKDLVLLRVLPMGWMHVYGKAPALTPADLRGRKVRIPADVATRLYLESLGYDLISVASTEVVTALQTGLVEAGTTVTLNYLWSGTNTEAAHLTLTGHSFLFTALYANKRWWQGLPAEHRKILDDAAPSGRMFFDSMTAAEARALAAAQADPKQGKFTVHALTPDQRAAWAASAPPIIDRLVRDIGGEAQALVDAVRRGAAAHAAQTRSVQ
ncbi:MAG: TRAP transporter substrate-binding protein [Rhodospirillaceae bacterium]|nr:TRAP transporter substrate-binding protein [Rhodospirillaceae bacterium]